MPIKIIKDKSSNELKLQYLANPGWISSSQIPKQGEVDFQS